MAGSLTGGGQGPIAGPPILSGEGSPEGVVTAQTGSLYRRTDSSGGTCLYVKEIGDNTNTGWSAGGNPTGTILDYAGPTAPPGYLLCFGQSVSRTTYANLFAVIGTTYGSVDANSFSIPECRGYVVAGKENMGGSHSAFNATNLSYQVIGNITNGSAVFHSTTPSNITPYFTRFMFVRGTGLPANTYIQTIDSATDCTMSANATATVTGGSFSVGQINGDLLGSRGGYPAHTLNIDEMPQHNHTYQTGWAAVSGIAGGANFNMTASGTGFTGLSHAHLNVQPTIIFNKMIKT